MDNPDLSPLHYPHPFTSTVLTLHITPSLLFHLFQPQRSSPQFYQELHRVHHCQSQELQCHHLLSPSVYLPQCSCSPPKHRHPSTDSSRAPGITCKFPWGIPKLPTTAHESLHTILSNLNSLRSSHPTPQLLLEAPLPLYSAIQINCLILT